MLYQGWDDGSVDGAFQAPGPGSDTQTLSFQCTGAGELQSRERPVSAEADAVPGGDTQGDSLLLMHTCAPYTDVPTPSLTNTVYTDTLKYRHGKIWKGKCSVFLF